LQYVVKDNTNTLRIAVKRGPTLADDVWHFWDLRPATTNPAWAGEWFDYNHAALSDNFLYVGSNAFTVAEDRWTRSVVFRVPLAVLAGTGIDAVETRITQKPLLSVLIAFLIGVLAGKLMDRD
jgi:hypothetical protein